MFPILPSNLIIKFFPQLFNTKAEKPILARCLFCLLLLTSGCTPKPLEEIPLIPWQNAEIFVLPTQPDAKVENIIKQYLQNLAAQGWTISQQGVWIQSDWTTLAQNQGKQLASAASLTKIATSLVALKTWGANHQFETLVYTQGEIKNGVLEGHLIIKGSGDPLFVWEEAITLGNTLNQFGIREVKGNLVIVDDFLMNFQNQTLTSGQFLQQALNKDLWSSAATKAYTELPVNTSRPQVKILGIVQTAPSLPSDAKLIINHKSLSLAGILKQMNIYSNNYMAQILGDKLGGGDQVATIAAEIAQIPQAEIKLINGSGLGVNNQMSPRAACDLFLAIQEQLKPESLTTADIFPVGGQDLTGTMKYRHIPNYATVKTGSLAQVSALAGIIPTQERGLVCFAIINNGGNIEKFRALQDGVLQNLAHHWQFVPIASKPLEKLGDLNRNVIVSN